MRRTCLIALLSTLCASGCAGTADRVQSPAAQSPPAAPPAPTAPDPPVPPYRERVIAGERLPQPLPAGQFRDQPGVAKAYEVAARIPVVLAQQPCYCDCDRMGHGSLLDCFSTSHGAG